VLITPASRKIEFKDSAGNVDGIIQLDSNGNLVLSSTVGLLIGDLDADIHIGDGSSVVDIVFDWSGSIYSVANKDLTIGKSSLGGNDIIIDSPNWSVTSAGDATFSGDVKIPSDSKKLYLGASDDLSIYHDGSNSYINEGGTGNLRLDGTTVWLNVAGSNIMRVESGQVKSFRDVNVNDKVSLDADTGLVTVTSSGHDMIHLNRTVANAGWGAGIIGRLGNSASTTAAHEYAAMFFQIEDNTDGAEKGSISFNTSSGGTAADDGATHAMQITSAGKVGIGTTTPDQLLDVEGSDCFTKIGYTGATMPAGIHSRVVNKNPNSGVPHWLFETVHTPTVDRDNEIFRIHGNETGDNHVFRVTTQGSTASPTHEALAILKDGKVGIGTTSPQSTLEVAGAILTDWGIAHSGDSNNSIAFTTDTQTFNTNGAARITIKDDGRVGIGTTAPDETLHVKVTSGDSGPIAKFERESQTGRVFIGSGNNWGNIWTDDTVLSFGVSDDYGADAQMRLYVNNDTAADAYSILELKGNGDNYINAGISLLALDDDASYRGLGVFMHDAQSDHEWYMGTPYSLSDSWIVGRKATSSHTQSTSDDTNSLFIIRNDGKVGIGETAPDSNLEITENTDGEVAVHVHNSYSGSNTSALATLRLTNDMGTDSNFEIKHDAWGSTKFYGNTTHSFTIANGGMFFSEHGSLAMKEKAAAAADTAAFGQLWVKTATPNQLYFTTDAGDDIQLTSGTSIAGGGGSGAVDSIANFSNNRVLTASDADSINGEANLTFNGTTLDVPTLTVDYINGDVSYTGTGIHTGLSHLGMGGAVPHSMTASGNSSRLAIEYESTVGTVNGHIALIGDSATDGQGPQILFSESGNGQGYVGGTIGFARTGSNSMGDLIFSTRQASGNTATTATESMRVVGGTSPKITFTHPVESTGNGPNYNLWEKVTFGKLDYGTSSGGGSGLKLHTFDDNEAGMGNFFLPADITIRAVQIRTSNVVLATHANKTATQVLRIFANGYADGGNLMDISYTMEDFTRQDSENANSTAHYVTFIGSNIAALNNTFDAGDMLSVRRNSGAYDMGDYIVHIWYSHDG